MDIIKSIVRGKIVKEGIKKAVSKATPEVLKKAVKGVARGGGKVVKGIKSGVEKVVKGIKGVPATAQATKSGLKAVKKVALPGLKNLFTGLKEFGGVSKVFLAKNYLNMLKGVFKNAYKNKKLGLKFGQLAKAGAKTLNKANQNDKIKTMLQLARKGEGWGSWALRMGKAGMSGAQAVAKPFIQAGAKNIAIDQSLKIAGKTAMGLAGAGATAGATAVLVKDKKKSEPKKSPKKDKKKDKNKGKK